MAIVVAVVPVVSVGCGGAEGTIRAVGYADHWGGTPDTWDVEDGDRYLGTIEVNPCDPQRYLPYLGSGEDLPAARTLTGAIDAITAADNNVHGGAS